MITKILGHYDLLKFKNFKCYIKLPFSMHTQLSGTKNTTKKQNICKSMKSEILTVVTVKSTNYWDVTPCIW